MYLLSLFLCFFFIQALKCDINEKLNGVDSNSTKSDKKVQFYKYISKEKSSKEIIAGTNLTTETYYCIKDTKDSFLIWDGNVGYGLMTTKTDKCRTSNAYQFEIVIDENGKIRIKNKQTDRFIARYHYVNLQYFFITNETNNKCDNTLRIVVRDNGFINIFSGSESYYLTSSYSFNTENGIYVISPVSSGSSIANWTFINTAKQADQPESPNSNSSFTLKIASFKYEMPNEETIQEYKNQYNILSAMTVNNTSSSKITHEISNYELIREKFIWEFDQTFELFSKVNAIRKLPKNIRPFLKSGETKYNLDPNSLLINNRKIEYFNEHEYKIKKSIDIRPESSLKIESYLDIVEDISIPFKAKGVIKSKDKISGQEIASKINSCQNKKLIIVDILSDSVTIEVSGELIATYVLNDFFNVVNTDLL
jgi:hypothetical protein